MKFSIAATDFSNMGTILSRFAAKEAADGFGYVEITIFDGIARFRTSNPEQTATVDYLVDSSKDGTVVIEASRFLKLAKAFSGIVTIELKGETLYIKQGKSKYALQTMGNPHLLALSAIDELPVKVNFRDALNKMAFSIDTSADNCMGYYWFDGKVIAASNQFTLCEATLNVDTGLHSCVPPSAIKDIKGEVEFRQNGKQIDISYGNFYLSSRLVEYPFPPYRKIIPEHENYISINRNGLMEILKRISIQTDTGSVLVSVCDSELLIKTTTDIGSGDESLSGTVNKEFEVEVTLNIKYITSALSAVGGETVQLYFGNSAQPVIVKSSEQNDFFTLIMPMR